MANIKFTELTEIAAGSVTDSDVLPIDDADGGPAVTYKISIGRLRTKVISPSSNGAESCGTASLRWAAVYSQNLNVLSSSAPQAQLSYDASNHLQVSVSSAGAVTYNATGASAGHTFSDAVTVAAGGLTVTAGGLTVSAGTTAVQALTSTDVVATQARTGSGTLSSNTSGVASTIFTAPQPGLTLVFAQVTNSGTNYHAFAVVTRATGGSGGTALKEAWNGANLAISVSGNDVQVTQSSGIDNIAVAWRYLTIN